MDVLDVAGADFDQVPRQLVRARVAFGEVGGEIAAMSLDAARELRRRGAVVLVIGEDTPLVARIGRAAQTPAASGLRARIWKERLAGASAVVTPDSGAAHVAGLVGVPCVDLFDAHAATARDIARWRPWASPVRARILDVTRSPEALACDVADDLAALVARRDFAPR